MGKKKNKQSLEQKVQIQCGEHTLDIEIDEDQRIYIENIRAWLRDSLKNIDKIVEGPFAPLQ